MEIVLEEAKNYGGYKEGKDPLVTRIKSEYFSIPNEYTTSKTDPTSVSWCAAFASWCLAKAGYANPSTCRALEFNPSYLHDGASKPDRPSHMRRISKPVYGCIIVWKNISGGGGHVAFHYGYESNGNIVPIGGNQGSSLQFSSRSPSGDYEQKIVGYFLPEDYEDNKEDEFKPEELKLDPKALNKSNLLKKSSNEISGKTT
ncbi:TIGR02594 family protein [Chryseobacterium sp. c4a]|nr:TIGR02594 family protein [Chryseobacterium sp. c4a]